MKQPRDGTSGWVGKFTRLVLWKAVEVVLTTLFFLTIAWRVQTLSSADRPHRQTGRSFWHMV